jgi:carboxypeptidase Taq
MTESYSQLEKHFSRLHHLEHALTFLQWDQQVMMPPGGNQARSESLAELSALYHEYLTAPRIGDLLDQAQGEERQPDRIRSIIEMRREYQWAVCLPADLVKAKSLAGSTCEHGWRTQRRDNDWKGFLKNFKPVVALAREEAQARQANNPQRFPTPYDAMLDLYCSGDSSSLISDIFSRLKQKLPDLIELVMERQAGRIFPITGSFPVPSQQRLNTELAVRLGFDLKSGRIDESAHPFSTGDQGDHRITSRFRTDDFVDALKATAHETGHAAYESGLPKAWQNLPVGQARNMSIHESQSLLFEKQIFLSKPFLHYFAPVIQEHLEIVRHSDWEQVWLNSIRVEPSYIRVEADELCYPLHVVIRYEIESALINGTMEPDDLPEAWDERMKTYLSLSTAGNFRDGCLQDIHWTDGSFGYFPAYTLGALNSAQIFAAFRRDHSDWRELLGSGQIEIVRDWLEMAIWSKGRLLESQDLMRSATGEGTNPDYFLAYLRERYVDEAY